MDNTLNVASFNVCGLRAQNSEALIVKALIDHDIHIVGAQEMKIPPSQGAVRALAGGYYSYVSAPRSQSGGPNIGLIYRSEMVESISGWQPVHIAFASERVGHFIFTHNVKDLKLHILVLHLPCYSPTRKDKALLKKTLGRYESLRKEIPQGPRHVVITTGDMNTTFDRECRKEHPHEFGSKESRIRRNNGRGLHHIAAGPITLNVATEQIITYKQDLCESVLNIMQGVNGDAFPIADYPRKLKHLLTHQPKMAPTGPNGQPGLIRMQLLDYITINKRNRHAVTNYHTVRIPQAISDHNMVVCNINLALILDKRRRQGRWQGKKHGIKWHWGGHAVAKMMKEREHDVDLNLIMEDDELCELFDKVVVNYRDTELARCNYANDINLPLDQQFQNIITHTKAISQLITIKTKDLCIARLAGRMGTRNIKESPRDLNPGMLALPLPTQYTEQQKYYTNIMWLESALTKYYDVAQLKFLAHHILIRNIEEQNLSELHAAERERLRTQIKATKNRIHSFKQRYHTTAYGIWFTNYMVSSFRSADIQDVYTKRKTHKRREVQPTKIKVTNAQGQLTSDSKKVAEIFKTTIQQKQTEGLMNVTAERLAAYRASDTKYLEGQAADSMNHCPTEKEVTDTLRELKNSASSDIKPADFLLASGPFLTGLTRIIAQIWTGDEWVAEWSNSKKLPLFKGKGKDINKAKNYRNITLLSIGRKIFTRIVLNRITKQIILNTPDYQLGFLPARGCSDALNILRQLINVCKRNKQTVCITYVDLMSAFPSVDRDMLIEALRRCGYLTPRIVSFIERMYHTTNTRVINGKEESEMFTTTRGAEEGCPLSPLLFVIYLDAMFKHLKEITPQEHQLEHMGLSLNVHNRKISTHLPQPITDLNTLLYQLVYADDLMFFHTNPASAKLNMVYVRQAFHDFGLDIEIQGNKCEFMVVNEGPEEKQQAADYTIAGETLKQVTKAKYLGSWVTADGAMAPELKHRLNMVNLQYNKLADRMNSPSFSRLAKMNFFQQLLFTNMSYASQSWNLCPAEYKKIDALQTKLIRRSLGFFRGAGEDPMSNKDIYGRARVNRWSMKIKGHILTSFAKQLPRRDTTSLRYRSLFLDRLHTVGAAPVYIASIPGASDFGRNKSRSSLNILTDALDSFKIPNNHPFTNEVLLPLDRLYQFGREVLGDAPVAPDGENLVFNVFNVKDNLKKELIDIKKTRNNIYASKRLPHFRHYNPMLLDDNNEQKNWEARSKETRVVFTDGSTKEATAAFRADASWAYIPLDSASPEAPLQLTKLPVCGRVITDGTDPRYFGADKKTNNTGELMAIAEALKDWIVLLDGGNHQVNRLLLCSDSQFSINVITGRYAATAHWKLVMNIQKLVKEISDPVEKGGRGVILELAHVNSHEGIRWNECADKYAKLALKEDSARDHTDNHYRALYPHLQ